MLFLFYHRKPGHQLTDVVAHTVDFYDLPEQVLLLLYKDLIMQSVSELSLVVDTLMNKLLYHTFSCSYYILY